MVKIVIYTTQEVVDARKKGLRVAGRLYTEKASEEHDEITVFLPYNRKPKKREKDAMVKKLPWGWVKESAMRLKVFGSFPKDLGTARVMGLLDEHTRDAKNALIDREIIEFV